MDTMSRVGLWLNGLYMILLLSSIFFLLPGLLLISTGPTGMAAAILIISIPVWGVKLGFGNRHLESFKLIYKLLWWISWFNLLALFAFLILFFLL